MFLYFMMRYTLVKSCLAVSTIIDVRLALANEEAEALKGEKASFPHEVTPSAFVNLGLELEEQQYVFSFI